MEENWDIIFEIILSATKCKYKVTNIQSWDLINSRGRKSTTRTFGLPNLFGNILKHESKELWESYCMLHCQWKPSHLCHNWNLLEELDSLFSLLEMNVSVIVNGWHVTIRWCSRKYFQLNFFNYKIVAKNIVDI